MGKTMVGIYTPWLTVEQAAMRIGVSQQTIRRRILDGSLKACRMGPGRSPFKIHESDLATFVAKAEYKPTE